MSYVAPSASLSKRLQIAEITITGSPAVNGYFTFNTLVDHTFDSAPTGLGTDTLSLPAGKYLCRATLDITRAAADYNYQFQFEADGSLIGKEGRSGLYNNQRSDLSEGTIEKTSAISLKLKCLGIENIAPTLQSGSMCYIWRVS